MVEKEKDELCTVERKRCRFLYCRERERWFSIWYIEGRGLNDVVERERVEKCGRSKLDPLDKQLT